MYLLDVNVKYFPFSSVFVLHQLRREILLCSLLFGVFRLKLEWIFFSTGNKTGISPQGEQANSTFFLKTKTTR